MIITGDDSAEVAHEALIREWPTLRGWLEENCEELRLHRHLTETALEWAGTDRAPDLLYRGARLTQIRERMTSHQEEMNTLECEFVAASVEGVAYHPDGNRLATASHDGTVKVWDLINGQEYLSLSTGAVEGQLGIAYSPNGTRLAAPGARGTAIVFDAETGQKLVTFQGHTDWVHAVAFSPDGTRLATASADQTAKIWDARSGQELLTLSGHAGSVSWVAFSPDGSSVATASTDATAKLWDARTGDELMTFAGGEWVNCLVFSPDGKLLAIANADRSVRIFEVATGDARAALRGHDSAVARVAFSPDGSQLAATGIDGKVKVWEVSSRQELLTLVGHRDAVIGVAFSPDCVGAPYALAGQCGARLPTVGWDGTARIWNVSLTHELLTLTTPAITMEAMLDLAQSRITRSFTVEECKKYLHQKSVRRNPETSRTN